MSEDTLITSLRPDSWMDWMSVVETDDSFGRQLVVSQGYESGIHLTPRLATELIEVLQKWVATFGP